MGASTVTTTKVAYTTAPRTSVDASRITSITGRGASMAAFSRRRRQMFSTSTIASSTTSPTAMARPPRIIPLSVTPRRSSTETAASIESGMAVRLISASLPERRNASRITMTSTAPRAMARPTETIEVRTKSACRSTGAWRTAPGGIEESSSAIAASTSRVTRSVSAQGSLSTWMAMAGRPS